MNELLSKQVYSLNESFKKSGIHAGIILALKKCAMKVKEKINLVSLYVIWITKSSGIDFESHK